MSAQPSSSSDERPPSHLRRALAALRTPTPYHVLPLAAGLGVAGGVLVPSIPFVYRLVACRLYLDRNPDLGATPDPGPTLAAALPRQKSPLDPVCARPEVEALTGSLMSAINVLEQFLALVSLSLFAILMSKRGRKSVLLAYQVSGFAQILCIIIAVRTPSGAGSALLLVLAALCIGLCGPQVLSLAAAAYITDLTTPQSRAALFGLCVGVQMAAGALASALGGWLGALTGDFLAPWYFALCFVPCICAYTALVVPESLPASKRLAAQRPEVGRRGSEESTASARVRERAAAVIRPLNFFARLVPLLPRKVRDDEAGGRRWRLGPFLAAVSLFIAGIGGEFLTEILALMTSREYGYGPGETGMILAGAMAYRALFLIVLWPAVSRWGRALFAPRKATDQQRPAVTVTAPTPSLDSPSPEQAANEATPLLAGEPGAKPATAARPRANMFNVVLTVVSDVLGGIGMLCVGLSTAIHTVVVGVVLICSDAGATLATRAWLTEITPREEVDTVLAATFMVEAVATFLSPIVVGSIYASTVKHHPRTVWFVCSGGKFLAGAVFSLVRQRWT